MDTKSPPNPITSCHGVEAVAVGTVTMHYQCPSCHQPVNVDGSNPNSNTDLREALTGIMYGADWRKDKRVANVHKPDVEAAIKLLQAHQQQLLSELLGKQRKYSAPIEYAVPVSVIHRKIGELNGSN